MLDLAIYTPNAAGTGRVRDEVRAITLPVSLWREIIPDLLEMIEAAEAASAPRDTGTDGPRD